MHVSHWCKTTHLFAYVVHACVRAQSRLTLCEPMDCSLQGSSVRGISQARILEWVAISFSKDAGLFSSVLG